MRYCSNCRTEIPEGESYCPQCEEYAGDVFDGKIRREKRPLSAGLLALLILAVIAAGAAVWYNRFRSEARTPTPASPSTRVVAGRPGDARASSRTQAEATRLLVAHLVAERSVTKDCLVVVHEGRRGSSYRFRAHNRCESTRLGRWEVEDGVVKRLTVDR
jgi:predicted nucleic acid-binding Zn ribbon protein